LAASLQIADSEVVSGAGDDCGAETLPGACLVERDFSKAILQREPAVRDIFAARDLFQARV
jgi:hypothetical protein